MSTRSKQASLMEPDEANAMLRELADGASKVFQNAVDLYEEASILHAAARLNRALFLYQISLEECAKIETLGAWAVSVLTGTDINVGQLTAAWASHKAKNYTNAYMLPATKAEFDARREGRWDAASEAFRQQQEQHHLESNSAKNASLYVDLQKNGIFTAPKERITEAMVTDIAATNEKYLAGAEREVRMMTSWLNNPDKVRDQLKWFNTRVMESTSRGDSPEDAISIILHEIVDAAKATGYYDVVTGGKNVQTAGHETDN